MRAEEYVAAVQAELTAADRGSRRSVPHPVRRGPAGQGSWLQVAVQELAELAHEIETERGPSALVTELGSPQSYAQAVLDALAPAADPADPKQPQTRLLGVPIELRGVTNRRVRSRIWDPADPDLVVPRLAGAGWTVNVGAVAVRLGLLRPDDVDDEVLARIPTAATTAARAVPAVVATLTAAALASRWRWLPSRVPTSWSLSGRPTRWDRREMLWVLVAVGAGSAGWAQLPPDDPQDRLVRSALATWSTILTSAAVGIAVADADAGLNDPGHGAVLLGTVPVAGLAALLCLVLPVRAGLRATWAAQARPS